MISNFEMETLIFFVHFRIFCHPSSFASTCSLLCSNCICLLCGDTLNIRFHVQYMCGDQPHHLFVVSDQYAVLLLSLSLSPLWHHCSKVFFYILWLCAAATICVDTIEYFTTINIITAIRHSPDHLTGFRIVCKAVNGS